MEQPFALVWLRAKVRLAADKNGVKPLRAVQIGDGYIKNSSREIEVHNNKCRRLKSHTASVKPDFGHKLALIIRPRA